MFFSSVGSCEKIEEEEDHGFEGTARKKKMTLGTLEKTMKKKTTIPRFRPRKRKPRPWSFGKKPRIKRT
jgi:hypothetical protein